MFTQQVTTRPKHHDGGHDYVDMSKQEQANICNDIGDHDTTRRVPTQRLNDSSRDKWECRGQSGLWKRRHQGWRHELFTPLRIPRGPSRGSEIARYRRTDGEYEDGTLFTVVDDWCDPSRAHGSLQRRWKGTTSFIQVKLGSFPDHLSAGFSECGDLLLAAPVDTVERDSQGRCILEAVAGGHTYDQRRVSFK